MARMASFIFKHHAGIGHGNEAQFHGTALTVSSAFLWRQYYAAGDLTIARCYRLERRLIGEALAVGGHPEEYCLPDCSTGT